MFLVKSLIIHKLTLFSHINLIEGQYKLNQIAAKTRLVTKLKKVEKTMTLYFILEICMLKLH